MVRRLVTAGFSTATIYRILRRWDVPEEELAGLENLEAERGEEREAGSGVRSRAAGLGQISADASHLGGVTPVLGLGQQLFGDSPLR